MKRILFFSLFLVSFSTLFGQQFDTITDVRDGQKYRIVKIGQQWWMAENLKATKYNDGTAIPLVKDDTAWESLTTPGYCWFNHDQATNKATYGALYNWYTVNTANLCPTGWHVPSDAEWTELTDYLTANGHSGTEGTALKATSDWSGGGNGTDDYGFTALPSGYRSWAGMFYGKWQYGEWWSSTKYDFYDAYDRGLNYNSSTVSEYVHSYVAFGYSVRCTNNTSIEVDSLIIDLEGTNSVCYGDSNGAATVMISGGTEPYSIIWDDDNFSTSHTVTGLGPNKWYHVTVLDASMQSATDSIYISELDSITIERVILGALCPGESNGSISINASGGTPPYEYLWSTDATTSSITNIPEGKYWVKVTDFNDCIKSDTIILGSAPIAPEAKICIVSLDSITRKNLVIWEKDSGKGIKSYKIYREGATSLDTLLIGMIPFDSLSVFLDETSEPEKIPHKYWITAVDSCGNESDYSPYHQAILLSSSIGPDRITLVWSEYEAEEFDNLVIGYKVLRSNTFLNYRVISSVSSSTTFYPDIYPPEDDNYYIVAGVLFEPCKPTSKLKAGTGPYVHSLSNMDDNKLRTTAINNIMLMDGMIIFPNPAMDKFTIQFANPKHESYQFILTDLTGKVLRLLDNIIEDKVEINRGGLSDGLYLIELRGSKIYRGKIVIE